MSVLVKYVGICIDSTFFCIGRSLENYIKMPLWSIKRPDYLQCTISVFFAGYSLNCGYESRAMFKKIRDSLKEDSFIDKHKRIYEIIQKYFLDEYTFSKCYFVYSRERGNSKDEINQRHNDI